MAFIDYSINNFCSKCVLEFSKELGIVCPECHARARTLPRNPKKFRSKNT